MPAFTKVISFINVKVHVRRHPGSAFLQTVEKTITRYSMLSGGETVLVGLSGGADSVCLLHVLLSLKEKLCLELRACYVDHGLRPHETPEEVRFCEGLCGELNVPFFVRVVDVQALTKEKKMNKQEAARELRHGVLEELSSEVRADRIALGHTADDQVETFFMRLLRGAGPRGLSGIPPVRRRIIRPLIDVERSEIERFLGEQGRAFRVDSSNLREDYLRNRIRLSSIPEFKRLNPHVARTVVHAMDVLREEDKYLDIMAAKTVMRLISRKSDSRIELFLGPLEGTEKVILRRVLRKAIDACRDLKGMEFVHIEEIIDLTKRGRPGDRLSLPHGLRAVKSYATLIITSDQPRQLGTVTLTVPGTVVLKEGGCAITASVADDIVTLGDGRVSVVCDADKAGDTLTVRAWEAGDFFYPLGFGKRKKLQDFFVDAKVPRDERGTVPIMLSGSDIVWIAGYRGDERYKVTHETKQYLIIEMKKVL